MMDHAEVAANPEVDSRSMEERLKAAYNDAAESLNLLHETLKNGGILQEFADTNIAKMPKDSRTSLESVVLDVESIGWMIRELNNKVVI